METARRVARPVRWRRSAALIVTGVMAVSLAGCGDEAAPADATPATATATEDVGTSATPSEVVLAAASSSAEAATANFSLQVDATAAGQNVSVSGDGQMDSARGALAMDLTTEVPGREPVSMRQVVVDGIVYLSGIPGAPEGQWVQVSLEELGGVSGSQFGGGSDPAQQLQLLQQVSDDVQEAGTEEINGVPTTKYTGTVDLQKAADAAEQQAPGSAATLKQQYEQLGLTTVPFEVFIDEDGRPARMTTTVSGSMQGQDLKVVSTIDFTEWGTDVDIQAPADAVPLAEVTGGTQG
jgi:hypothetical protein